MKRKSIEEQLTSEAPEVAMMRASVRKQVTVTCRYFRGERPVLLAIESDTLVATATVV